MGFFDKVKRVISGDDYYDDYDEVADITSNLSDGCVGESRMSQIRRKLESLIPC